MNPAMPRSSSLPWIQAIVPWLASLVLAGFFWKPILEGAGITGGDTYAYFLPLRQFYAEGLKANQWWFWNPKIGHGIPVLGESQTGFFYPPYLVAYRFLDVDRAYSAIFLMHYVLAFVFTTWLARAMGLRLLASLLVATVFVYGWFPPRSCFEWSIVTGAWMPLLLLFFVHWLNTGRVRWGCALSLALAMQLLAGHFQIAFLTLLAMAWLAITVGGEEGQGPIGLGRRSLLLVFVGLGFLLAAPQLAATWELKVRSQRQETNDTLQVTNTIPLSYFPQMVAPFLYYTSPRGQLVGVGHGSNNIEAHLYVGLIPFGLAAACIPFCRRRGWKWLGLALVAAVLANGSLGPWLAYLPGFGYFQAPGRYGLLAQLGLAMLAGLALDAMIANGSSRVWVLGVVMLAATIADLYWVSRKVTFTRFEKPPLVARLADSPVASLLRPTDRVLGPVPNILSLTGASSVPPYVGLMPTAYATLWESKDFDKFYFGEVPATEELLDRWRRAGVTHFLTRARLGADWQSRLLWSGFDPFLHRAYGIPDRLFLYQFGPGPGRVHWRKDGKIKQGYARLTTYAPHQVEIECEVDEEAELVLTDLTFPGWSATVDGIATEAITDPHFRVVRVPAGRHRVHWQFIPRLLYPGAIVSGMTLLAIGIGAPLLAFKSRKESSKQEREGLVTMKDAVPVNETRN